MTNWKYLNKRWQMIVSENWKSMLLKICMSDQRRRFIRIINPMKVVRVSTVNNKESSSNYWQDYKNGHCLLRVVVNPWGLRAFDRSRWLSSETTWNQDGWFEKSTELIKSRSIGLSWSNKSSSLHPLLFRNNKPENNQRFTSYLKWQFKFKEARNMLDWGNNPEEHWQIIKWLKLPKWEKWRLTGLTKEPWRDRR